MIKPKSFLRKKRFVTLDNDDRGFETRTFEIINKLVTIYCNTSVALSSRGESIQLKSFWSGFFVDCEIFQQLINMNHGTASFIKVKKKNSNFLYLLSISRQKS